MTTFSVYARDERSDSSVFAPWEWVEHFLKSMELESNWSVPFYRTSVKKFSFLFIVSVNSDSSSRKRGALLPTHWNRHFFVWRIKNSISVRIGVRYIRSGPSLDHAVVLSLFCHELLVSSYIFLALSLDENFLKNIYEKLKKESKKLWQSEQTKANVNRTKMGDEKFSSLRSLY